VQGPLEGRLEHRKTNPVLRKNAIRPLLTRSLDSGQAMAC
jgi:hypothetical protein